MKNAGLYIRVSTEEQAKHGLSLNAQYEALKKYANDNGYSIVDVYKDEGISARNNPAKRREFCRMIEDVKLGRLTHILFIKLDRWFRNVSDYYKYQAILDSHNVQWVATEENYNTTTSQGRLYLNIKLTIAQNECDMTSDRIKFVLEQRRKKGLALGGRTAIGYARNKEGRFIIDEEKAKIVKEIFELYLREQSVAVVESAINKKYNMNYSNGAFRTILRNTAYIGKKNCYPPILDESTFYKVQEVLINRKKASPARKKHNDLDFLFTGMLECPYCKRRLTSSSSKHVNKHGETKHYIYYRCYTNTRTIKSCPAKDFCLPERKVEKLLLKNIRNEIEKARIKYLKLSNTPADDIKSKVSNLNNKKNRLKELYIDGIIDRAEFDEGRKKIEKQLAPLLNIELSRPRILELSDVDFESIYSQLTRENKAKFWRRILKYIMINYTNDNLIIEPVFL